MAPDEILVERRGPVVALTLNRPGSSNALTGTMLERLRDALRELSAESEVRCVLLRGAGDRAFSVGMDLKEMSLLEPAGNLRLIGPGGPLRAAIENVEHFPYPVLAVINGFALGAACELAISADLRIGAMNAVMGMPPARLGIVYPPEGVARFVRTVGLPVTRRLFYTAERFTADRLVEMGMLDVVVEANELEAYAWDLGSLLAGNAPLSMKGHKRILASMVRGPEVPPGERREMDHLVSEAIHSDDAAECIAAFLEKRPPEFRGR